MTVETLVESQERLVALTPDEAHALGEAGVRLASKWAWWGEREPIERTVIQVRRAAGDLWSVRVADAVGVIAVGAVQLLVQPKIPVPHLLHLFEQSTGLPRLDGTPARLRGGDSLWSLVASWLLTATEALLRRDLVRDYQTKEEEVVSVRGRVTPLPTAAAFYSGRPTLHCHFSEFGVDTPLNRVLKAAVGEVVASVILGWALRRRGLRILSRLGDIGGLQPDDCHVTVDRRTGHYADAITLALHVLRGVGRALSHGPQQAWTFLLRTPEMVEDGLRNILARTLGPGRVEKKGIRLTGSSLTFNPEAFRARYGAIIRFRSPGVPSMSPIVVGDKRITEVTWPADEGLDPVEAAVELVSATRRWLDGLPAPTCFPAPSDRSPVGPPAGASAGDDRNAQEEPR